MTRHVVAALLLLAGLAVIVAAQGPPPRPGEAPEPDWPSIIAGMRQDLAEAKAEAAGQSPEAVDSNLPLMALEIEKMALRLSMQFRGVTWSIDQEVSQDRFEVAARRLAANEPAHVGEQGTETGAGYFERAYLCRTDRSPQPYFVRLPDGYSPDREWPLVIFLHGYVPDTSKIDPWVLPSAQWQQAAERGYIMVMPHGRRNSDFLGIGEVDVLRVFEEMQRWYRVDADRVYLTGCSMGGYGGWALGLRHADRWAALGLMSGQTDFFLWERRDRDEVRFKSWCIEQNNPIDLAVNARWLPVYVQHGELDNLVPVAHSRLIAPIMEQLGYGLRYQELTGQGHYIYWESEPFERIFDWLAQYRRPQAPRELVHKTYTTRHSRAWWTTIRRFARAGAPGQVSAQVGDDGTVSLTCENVAAIDLDLPGELVRPAGNRLVVNGEPAGSVGPGPHRVTIAETVAVQPAPEPVVPLVLPPAREVFNDPFLMVYATGGDAATQDANYRRAAALQRKWYAFAEGIAPCLADHAVNEVQVREHNLVLCGEPSTVRLAGVADAAVVLPEGVSIARGDYAVGERRYTGDQFGMFLLTRHPLTAGRQVLWVSGAEYGQRLPANHQFDLIPELLVYRADAFAADSANQFLVGGWLTLDGRLDPTLLDVHEP